MRHDPAWPEGAPRPAATAAIMRLCFSAAAAARTPLALRIYRITIFTSTCRRAGDAEPLAVRRGVKRSAAARGETEGQAGGDGDGGMVHELEVQVRLGGVARVSA